MTQDQRGIGRSQPAGGICDIGTYELDKVVNAKGDVGRDEKVDILDACLCLQIALGVIDETPLQREQANVDRDDDVDMNGVQIPAEYTIGICTSPS